MSPAFPRNTCWVILFTMCLFTASARCQADCDAARSSSEIAVCLGVTTDGSVTDTWYDAIKDRRPPAELEQIRRTKRPLTKEELDWVRLVENLAEEWSMRRPKLNIPFRGVEIPNKIYVLLGDQLGDDAFTYRDDTICLDVEEMATIYGSPTTTENRDRLIRILDHEYTHLAHHAWILKHPISLNSPFDRALRNLLVEGFGNYRSLSAQWVDDRGRLTPLAWKTLSDLQPIFVERLTKLRAANVEEEDQLMRGLSSGPLNKKWGAITVALWLAEEARGDDRRLRKWVKAGPRGIIKLARKHLPTDLKAGFPK